MESGSRPGPLAAFNEQKKLVKNQSQNPNFTRRFEQSAIPSVAPWLDSGRPNSVASVEPGECLDKDSYPSHSTTRRLLV